jgi:hypothetical protein
MTSNSKLIISIATCIALLMPLGSQATAITNIAISGNYTVYKELTPTHLTQVASPTITDVQAVLMNNSVRGNVQLGSPLTPLALTTMTVDFAGGAGSAIFSNLLKGDWTDNNNALVHSYITAAANSVSFSLSPHQLDVATDFFINNSVGGGFKAWQLASDPTIATIDLVNGHIIVGQDGLFNPVNYLNSLFAGTGAPSAPANAQASEVVKVSYNGNTRYLYSFSAKETGYSSDGVSYTGRYIAQAPEPTTLLLLGIGFIGLSYMRRNNKADSAIGS